ncbi:Hypothetical predicted protein [Lecanosticta acicola]|uniref:Uncharacterized protein n=1 Tax=Lecanosticta acicola TaxID=111012 RepID=A0AAI9E8Z2_9PEZI|nr:Hypothetical predicted protein [Lecanosticta acicola]
MRRWSVRGLLSNACRRPLPRPRPRLRLVRFQPASTASLSQDKALNLPPTTSASPVPKYAIFGKIHLPPRDPDAWAALLDGALPPHLRDWTTADWTTAAPPPNLSAVDVAEILLAAQHPQKREQPLDLLYHLGINQGRWNAVVWLVKKIVDKFPVRHSQSSRLSNVNSLWNGIPLGPDTLDEPFALSMDDATTRSGLVEARSLDELTADPTHAPQDNLQHDALGQIWQSLGAMTRACAGGEIQPEVLEIIAYLHHREVMPMSIYQSHPHPDKSAVQQPPLLSLLSSRILTSLSDAAWRAHEKLVVEEAKAMGGEYAALRPEVPGSVYRVHVAGLRPEVWMEMILWSCIRGGWTVQGADILRSIVTIKQGWKPLSWREYEKSISLTNGNKSPNWAELEYLFKTRPSATTDPPSAQGAQIDRTVSAEVVNAYVDAITSNVSDTADTWGFAVQDALSRLTELRVFLRRPVDCPRDAPPKLSLSTGTWTAQMLRVIDTAGVDAAANSAIVRKAAKLESSFAKDILSRNTRDLPEYVLDGDLALHGLLVRALYGQIAAGSVEGTVQVFREMQRRTEENKLLSLQRFMLLRESFVRSVDRDGMFNSNLPGIEFPGFTIEIPTTILGSFLELLTETKQLSLAQGLLEPNDIGEAIVGEHLLEDPFIQPAVLRYASESNDTALLEKLRTIPLAEASYRAILDSHVGACRWDAAKRVLANLPDNVQWSISNLASVIRTMLMQVRGADAGNPACGRDLKSASDLLFQMCYKYRGTWEASKFAGLRTLLFVLAGVDRQWASFSVNLMRDMSWQYFTLDATDFNSVLEGVVHSYGSAAGQRLVERFWPPEVRLAQGQRSTERGTIRRLRGIDKYQRIVIPTPPTAKGDDGLVMRGGLLPNTRTISIVLRAALVEIQPQPADAVRSAPDMEAVDYDPHSVAHWAVQRLSDLPNVEDVIVENLDKTLAEKGLHDIRAELPEIQPQNEALAEEEELDEE